jgi:hypothetical protein
LKFSEYYAPVEVLNLKIGGVEGFWWGQKALQNTPPGVKKSFNFGCFQPFSTVFRPKFYRRQVFFKSWRGGGPPQEGFSEGFLRPQA